VNVVVQDGARGDVEEIEAEEQQLLRNTANAL
jgi:hypothetical protein